MTMTSLLRSSSRIRWIELALLAALAVLSAGAAGAELLNSPTLCEAIGGQGQDARFCLPSEPESFPQENFAVSDDADPLFIISGEATAISLTINSGVTGNELDGTGFRLIGLRSNPPNIEPIELEDIDYLGDWTSSPTSLPVVTNSDDMGATIEWTNLVGANPVTEAAIVINLHFVPEPVGGSLVACLTLSLLARGRRAEVASPPRPPTAPQSPRVPGYP